MNIQFLGAARTVSGSCYVIEANGLRFAVDFGMHQGGKIIDQRNWKDSLYNAEKLDFIILTHAHIDHSGLLPKAVKDGFKGKIFCTEPTLALLDVMLQDSGHIQEMDAAWSSKKRARQGEPPVDPLYTVEDSVKVMSHVVAVPYGRKKEFENSGISFTFRDAGHILGSSFVEMEVVENGVLKTLLFSGDLGRTGAFLLDGPSTPTLSKPDYLFIESTYGDRNHKSSESSIDELIDAIHYSYKNNEKIIIPAFAIERTQELLYILRGLFKAKKIPANLPVYVDSPLAIKATEIFRNHLEFLNKETSQLIIEGEDPFKCPVMEYTPEPAQSQQLNTMKGSCIILSASGMCNAGRIRHHLKHNLWRKGASIVFTGYQAVGTPGRRIVEGVKKIFMLGEDIDVNAKVYTIGGFSAHAGQDQLIDWVKSFAHPEMKVFVMHGEEKAQKIFAKRLEHDFGVTTYIPEYCEICELNNGVPVSHLSDEVDHSPVDWESLVYSLRVGLEGLENSIPSLSEKSEDEQLDLVDRITELRVRIKQLSGQVNDKEKAA